MVKIITAVFVCLSLLLSVSNAQAEDDVTLNFATEELPPFNYQKSGEPAGPAVELVKNVCAKLNKTCSIGLYPWRRAEAMTRAGHVQGLFSVGWNKPREKWLFYSTPVFSTEYGFFECEEKKFTYSPAQKMKGMTIGVYGPSNLSFNLEKIRKELGNAFTIEVFTDNPSLFRKLSRCRLDAVYCTKEVGLATIRQMELSNIRYAHMDKKIYYHIGFSRISTAEKLFQQFNRELLKMKKTGELNSIARKFGVTAAD